MKKKKKIKKEIPWDKLKTEDDVANFFDQDISEYLEHMNFVPMKFELLPKDKAVTFRMSEDLFEELKKQAKKQGIGYQKFMRAILESYLRKVS